ncbi:MAG: aldolase catalytic domain-containing protein [Bacteroidales bacterium]|nr:aldolase catalytic domain-containing protein [Bacteroidales bacterium]
MNKIQILDCTLRDGGYVNDFNFGENSIRKIIKQLTDANIDIIECGFLEDCDYDRNCSIYDSVEQIRPFIPAERKNSFYVAMACYGEYDLNKLSEYDGTSVDGIRVTFHYNEVEEALGYCKQIIDKGYKVFVQPVGTSSYTDEQLLTLISSVNRLKPYAFYLVDTLGLMLKDDILRFYYLINHNLNKSIHFGFHSHNNLQLSYSNCQLLAELNTDRVISLDASVKGMGRGAGNLNTELLAYYLNTKARRYEIEPILDIVDEFISKINLQFSWGYDVPHYLAAINGCHPNYASYLVNKQTLTAKNISTILRLIPVEKRSLFNKELAEQMYIDFQSKEVDDRNTINELKGIFADRNVLVLAPGPSLSSNKERILDYAEQHDCLVVSVAFVPEFIETDYVFLSNLKRYNTTFNPSRKKINLIHTSNIEIDEEGVLIVNYSSLLNEEDVIIDNTAMMFLNLLTRLSPSKVFCAGLDGYHESGNNYYLSRLVFSQDSERIHSLNTAIKTKIRELSRLIKIEFITESLYA